jgi:hypothetical protein
MRLLHGGRDGPPALTAVRGTRSPARSPRAPLRRAFRKRRRLPRAGSTSGFQFVLQARVLSLKSCPLALHPCTVGFGPRQLLSQPHDLLSQLVDRLVRPRLACARHAPVMPEFSRRYKSDAVTRYFRPLVLPRLIDYAISGIEIKEGFDGSTRFRRFAVRKVPRVGVSS